jgi:hypothetical protein
MSRGNATSGGPYCNQQNVCTRNETRSVSRISLHAAGGAERVGGEGGGRGDLAMPPIGIRRAGVEFEVERVGLACTGPLVLRRVVQSF